MADVLGAINDLYDYLLAGKNNLDVVISLIVEAVKRGEPVYLTNRAAQQLRSILEKHGIRLVPAKRIEDKAIVIDVEEDKARIMVRQSLGQRWLGTEYRLEDFVEALDKNLRRAKKLILLFLLGPP